MLMMKPNYRLAPRPMIATGIVIVSGWIDKMRER
jgi:hypothetical protein